MGKKFEKNVRWNFTISIHGHGKNIRSALLNAAENFTNEVEMDLQSNDFESMEQHNVVSIQEDDVAIEDLGDEYEDVCPKCANPKAFEDELCEVCSEDV